MADATPTVVPPGTVVEPAVVKEDIHGEPVAAVVPVQSAWLSKINWAQGVTGAAVILAYFGVNLTPEVQAAILAMIAGVNVVSTWVLRTWFNGSVNVASISK